MQAIETPLIAWRDWQLMRFSDWHWYWFVWIRIWVKLCRGWFPISTEMYKIFRDPKKNLDVECVKNIAVHFFQRVVSVLLLLLTFTFELLYFVLAWNMWCLYVGMDVICKREKYKIEIVWTTNLWKRNCINFSSKLLQIWNSGCYFVQIRVFCSYTRRETGSY